MIVLAYCIDATTSQTAFLQRRPVNTTANTTVNTTTYGAHGSTARQATLNSSLLSLQAGPPAPGPLDGTDQPNGGPALVETQLTQKLNKDLENGLVVFSPDSGVESDYAPATYWNNKITTPNQNFLWDMDQLFSQGKDHFLYNLPNIGFVADPDKFNAGNLWGDQVTMYGHDANACDSPGKESPNPDKSPGVPATSLQPDYGRCTWFPDPQIWDCPGGFFPGYDSVTSGSFKEDATKKGAGNYDCRGCHISQIQGLMDQEDRSILQTNCECPCTDYISCYEFATGQLRTEINKDPDADNSVGWMGYDWNICWVDNDDALAGIQNGLYESRGGNMLKAEDAEKQYWGWNEVAVKAEIKEAKYWASAMIFIPAYLTKSLIQSGYVVSDEVKDHLRALIDIQVKPDPNGVINIKPGWDNIGKPGGSDIVYVAEKEEAKGRYKKYFFCMYLDLPGDYKICSAEMVPNNEYLPGNCYVEERHVPCGSPRKPSLVESEGSEEVDDTRRSPQ